jgi:hypothetical protein
MTIDSFALIGTALFAIGAITAGTIDWLRTNRRHREWVHGLSLAPTETMPTSYEQEWLQRGWDRDNQVEDFELADAYIGDKECAALDEWFGLPVLPDTPETVRRLSRP